MSGVLCGVALLLCGCQYVTSRLESAAYFSITSAGYAGRFRLAYGRWPANVNELEEFMCMRGRAEQFGLERLSCNELVTLPYRTVLEPQGQDLRIRYFDSANALMCSLKLRAPRVGVDAAIFPAILIESTMFSCSGSPWKQRSADLG
jgi:hypothetical protein